MFDNGCDCPSVCCDGRHPAQRHGIRLSRPATHGQHNSCAWYTKRLLVERCPHSFLDSLCYSFRNNKSVNHGIVGKSLVFVALVLFARRTMSCAIATVPSIFRCFLLACFSVVYGQHNGTQYNGLSIGDAPLGGQWNRSGGKDSSGGKSPMSRLRRLTVSVAGGGRRLSGSGGKVQLNSLYLSTFPVF